MTPEWRRGERGVHGGSLQFVIHSKASAGTILRPVIISTCCPPDSRSALVPNLLPTLCFKSRPYGWSVCLSRQVEFSQALVCPSPDSNCQEADLPVPLNSHHAERLFREVQGRGRGRSVQPWLPLQSPVTDDEKAGRKREKKKRQKRA